MISICETTRRVCPERIATKDCPRNLQKDRVSRAYYCFGDDGSQDRGFQDAQSHRLSISVYLVSHLQTVTQDVPRHCSVAQQSPMPGCIPSDATFPLPAGFVQSASILQFS